MSSPWPGSAGAGVWSLRGSGSPGYQLVPELLEDVGTDELLQSIDARRSNVQEPSPLVPSGVRLQPVSLSQRQSQHRHLFEGEAVGLERHSREIGCAVIHDGEIMGIVRREDADRQALGRWMAGHAMDAA